MSLEALRKKEEAENEGVWEPFPPPMEGEAWIAHHQNPAYQKLMRRYIEQVRRRYKNRPDWTLEKMLEAEGDADSKVRDFMVGTTFRGIRGVFKEPGVPLESTPENLRAILDTRDGFEFVDRISKSIRADVEEEIEDAAKNSEPSTAGAFVAAV